MMINDDDSLPINYICERQPIVNEIIKILKNFDEKCQETTFKKGIYIYGSPGTGKTRFVVELLKQLSYDVIVYDAGDVRNKSLFQTIDSNHLSNRNVLDLMNRRVKKIAILMDEIDGMNNGDKGGIDALIKLIRQKKTKKQKAENTTLNPIICIGNHKNDKKIRELMKACHTFELKTPTDNQICSLLRICLPPFSTKFDEGLQEKILLYIQGDLRKLRFLSKLWKNKPYLLTEDTIEHIFHTKMFNEDAKKITWKLINTKIPLEEHTLFMNETDRTTVALLWHENITVPLSKMGAPKTWVPFYASLLDNICFADYIGRITFQSQIWQFNEMGSLIKTFYNNKLYHDYCVSPVPISLQDIDFTKVLTKYSTEYNNQIFLYSLCQKMNMDKKDLVSYFQELRILFGKTFYSNAELLSQVEKYLGKDDVDVLDIKRIYRFLDKNVKKDAVDETIIGDGDDDDDCSSMDFDGLVD